MCVFQVTNIGHDESFCHHFDGNLRRGCSWDGTPGLSRRLEKHELEVHDVGAGGTGDEEAAGAFEEGVGIVVFEILCGVQASRPGRGRGATLHHCPCRIRRPVRAVRARGEKGDAFFTFYVYGKGEGQLHVPPPGPLPSHRHRRLPAGDQADGVPSSLEAFPHLSRLLRKPPACIRRLPPHSASSYLACEPEFATPGERSYDGLLVAPDNRVAYLSEDGIAPFRGLRYAPSGAG